MKRYVIIVIFFTVFSLNSQIYFTDQSNIVGVSENTGVVSMGGGVSFVDYDEDGWDDISLGTGNGQSIQFYKNYDGFFVQESLLPIDLNFQNKSIIWVDFDNDGDKDLFVTSQTDGNRFFEKLSDNSLIDITISAGFVLENMYTFGASWGDINNDGCLDVYLSNYKENTTITNYLYQSNCDGTFTEITNEVGLANIPALTFCSGFFDFNNDGWQDLYIANDKVKQNHLYKNNGDGTFTDVSQSSGTDLVIDAMSVTIDDFNSDGFLDIFMTNTPNNEATTVGSTVLLKNNGDETFTNISESSGTQLNSWSWGSNFLDAENDGDLDLYISCSYDGSNGFPSYGFYENIDGENFANLVNSGFENSISSFSSAIGDTNNDGLLDIVVNNNNHAPFIWNNQTSTINNYIKVKLIGTESNRDAIGSKIEIYTNDNLQYHYIMCGEGYLSQNSLVQTIGINEVTNIDYIKVTWLSGIEDIVYNVTPNQFITIIEGNSLSINNFGDRISVNFKNPVDDTMQIDTSHLVENLTLYNSTGALLLEKPVMKKQFELNLYTLQAGIYFCSLKFDNDRIKIIKLIKR
ncbi:FG-GAP-like repeat-containing protein [Winogradskyella schleiferi]|uniref:FG-GAP-like repeat-containing protein n=1 Tax=Winogradskyella schleiferi TaxID=2686078 RepID=UPI0015B82275|nr:FG-GAP-like repeat-containing protein [Winogradskyella schleiferi]